MRAGFGGARTVLRDLTVYYQPQNQRPRVTEITVGDEATQKHVSAFARSAKPRSPVVKLRWRVDNPDDDDLIYRLSYREESETNWKPIGGAEPLTRTEYEWNTESIPDGNYVVRVIASDERSNPREEALEHSLHLDAVPRRQPQARAERRQGRLSRSRRAARTTASRRSPSSPIRSTAATGSRSRPRTASSTIRPRTSACGCPSGLAAGGHSLAVRAVDAADNVGAIQLTFRVR